MSNLGVVDLNKYELSDSEKQKKEEEDKKEVDPQDEVWNELTRILERLERGVEGDLSMLGRAIRSLNRFRIRLEDYTWLRVIHTLVPETYREEFLNLSRMFNGNIRQSEILLISKLCSISLLEAEEKLKKNSNQVSTTILEIVKEKEEMAKKEILRQQAELKKEREEREAKTMEAPNKNKGKEKDKDKDKEKEKEKAKENNKDKEKGKTDDKKTDTDGEKEKELEVSLMPLKERKKKRQFYPETYVFLQLLLVLEMFDRKNYQPCIDILTRLINFTKQQNRRTCDLLTARVYSFYSLCHQRLGKLNTIRHELYNLYQTACLQQNEPGQGVLINLILQNYISDNAYALAHKFSEKSEFPDSCSSQQFARYHYYNGRIDCVQLEYGAALFHMQQAIRRAPQQGAIGFKLTSTKWLITIHLLMGDIPDRTLFRSFKSIANRLQLQPYLEMTQAVREGKIDAFNECLKKNYNIFKQEGLQKVLIRLRHNVIKTGLRAINRAYSRISLADICNKLGLENENDAYFIVAKAIRDGVIDATIDYTKSYVEAKKVPDIYATSEPYEQFSTRVKFCLDIYDTGIKALRYPEEKDEKKDEDKDKPTPEEIADMIRKEIEEEHEDD